MKKEKNWESFQSFCVCSSFKIFVLFCFCFWKFSTYWGYLPSKLQQILQLKTWYADALCWMLVLVFYIFSFNHKKNTSKYSIYYCFYLGPFFSPVTTVCLCFHKLSTPRVCNLFPNFPCKMFVCHCSWRKQVLNSYLKYGQLALGCIL